MKDLILQIAQALVDHPEQVSVTEIQGNQTSVLELKVAKDDLGKIIGKQGRTARYPNPAQRGIGQTEKTNGP